MLVVIVGLTTAAALASVTVKFSGPSTTESCVVAIVKLNSAAPVARSAAVVFVAVTLITPPAPVLVVNTIPAAAVSPPASSAEKSVPSVAVPDALSSVNVTLWPAPSPTPLRLTV